MNLIQDVRMKGAGNLFLIHVGDCDTDKLLNNLGGADGLLIVSEDQEADANMRIINADGREAEQCGNGLRCVALHLLRSRIVDKNEISIKTLSGMNKCVVHIDLNQVEVTMCVPREEKHLVSEYPNLVYVNMGNPNAVFWTENDPIQVRSELGKYISEHTAFVNGMNVHFARRDREQYATSASFERGVGNTLSSGTGGASVFVASGNRGLFHVSSVGGTLTYRYNESGEVVMSGPASYE